MCFPSKKHGSRQDAHKKNESTEETKEKKEGIMWGNSGNAGLINKSGDSICVNESQLNRQLWTGAPYGRTHTERPATADVHWDREKETLAEFIAAVLHRVSDNSGGETARGSESPWSRPWNSDLCLLLSFSSTAKFRRIWFYFHSFVVLLKLLLMNCRALHQ